MCLQFHCHYLCLIDSVDGQMSGDVIRYELDEYFFMPDPHQFISTHFPHDSHYQLLEKTVSLEEFEQLVPVKSTFYKYGLELTSHTNATVSVDQEETIVIKCPPPEVWFCAVSVISVETGCIQMCYLCICCCYVQPGPKLQPS